MSVSTYEQSPAFLVSAISVFDSFLLFSTRTAFRSEYMTMMVCAPCDGVESVSEPLVIESGTVLQNLSGKSCARSVITSIEKS